MSPERYSCYNVTLDSVPGAEDACWDQAPSAELKHVVTGKRPFLSTEFRVIRDDAAQALYVRILAEDDAVNSTYRLHDEPIYTQDVFEMFVSDAESLDFYREIEVSPYDVTFCGNITFRSVSDFTLDMDWDTPGFVTKTRYNKQAHRTVSLWVLPYAIFKNPPKAGSAWPVNFFRIDHSVRGEELQAWQPTGEPRFHRPQFFGLLDFK
ncbi:MAG: carbohydrate-binding family 9-like protein [Bacillota bacterium]|nr:carbohydrate-binding family 9-like protein [Bacillota bacterium]